MTALEDEIDANQESFFERWTDAAANNWKTLAAAGVTNYKESYRRIACLNALRVTLVDPNTSKESAAFFLEAQNDALVSHVSAGIGAWRSALQALRGSIENVFNFLYYKDHPVELAMWAKGSSRLGFSELAKYLTAHPATTGKASAKNAILLIESEYATLSKAVHSSAESFRMTAGAETTLLWSTENVKLNMWSTRERKVIEGLSILIAAHFAKDLQGARNIAVRQVLSFAIPATKRALIKSDFDVTIRDA
jgi:hypothetical protein